MAMCKTDYGGGGGRVLDHLISNKSSLQHWGPSVNPDLQQTLIYRKPRFTADVPFPPKPTANRSSTVYQICHFLFLK